MKKLYLLYFCIGLCISPLYGIEGDAVNPVPKASSGDDHSTIPGPTGEKPIITAKDLLRYLKYHLINYPWVQLGNQQHYNLATDEGGRLWDDFKDFLAIVPDIFNGIKGHPNSSYSNDHPFRKRILNALENCWDSPNLRATLAGTGTTVLLDFLLTTLTTEKASEQSRKAAMKSFIMGNENSRLLAFSFYMFLSMMGSRLSDVKDFSGSNSAEVLIKVSLACAASSLVWNTSKRYLFGKGSNFLENIKKSLKFSLLCATAMGTSHLMAAKALK